jgi:hypothetical protein
MTTPLFTIFIFVTGSQQKESRRIAALKCVVDLINSRNLREKDLSDLLAFLSGEVNKR